MNEKKSSSTNLIPSGTETKLYLYNEFTKKKYLEYQYFHPHPHPLRADFSWASPVDSTWLALSVCIFRNRLLDDKN